MISLDPRRKLTILSVFSGVVQAHWLRKKFIAGKHSEYIVIALLIEILIEADILGQAILI